MKIGILTYHRAHNYGAFLQAYGLCSALNQETDVEAEIIDFSTDELIRLYDEKRKSWKFKILKYPNYRFIKKRRQTFEKALSSLILSPDYLHSDNVEDFVKFVKNKYDMVIVGSDEIWRLKKQNEFPTPYWLPDDLGCIKVSYAASSRTDFSFLSCENIKKIEKFLKDFKIISVRDQITYNEFKKILPDDKTLQINADPSFVFDYKANAKNGRLILSERLKLDINKKIVLVMTENDKLAQMIRKKLKKDCQLVSVFHWHLGYINVADLTPFEWVDAIAGADFVFSSYFHGVCFSIINNTPFLAVGTNYEKTSKLSDVINRTDNNNRYVSLLDLRKDKLLLKKKWLELQNKPKGKEYIKSARSSFKDYVNMIKKLDSKK